MTAALAAASARYGVSVAERLATDGRGALRRVFAPAFQAAESVLFIHWRGGSRAARRAGRIERLQFGSAPVSGRFCIDLEVDRDTRYIGRPVGVCVFHAGGAVNRC